MLGADVNLMRSRAFRFAGEGDILLLGRLGAVVAVVCVGLLAATPAAADVTFGTFGSGPGQTDTPHGLAVDFDSGELYVADGGNNRVDVFDVDGQFLRQFGAAGTGRGEFLDPTAIAVDNGDASSSKGDVYVYDSANHRVEKFSPSGELILMFGDGVNKTSGGDVCPRPAFPADVCGPGTGGNGEAQLNEVKLAIGPGGVVYVAESLIQENSGRLQKFTPSGEYLEEIPLPDGEGVVQGIAIDATGPFYVGEGGDGHVWKYPPAGPPPICEFNPSFNITALAVDSDNSLFVADNTGGAAIYEYDDSCSLNLVFSSSALEERPDGIAVFHSDNGDVFASQGSGPSSKVVYLTAPPPGPLVLPNRTGVVPPLGSVRATLKASVNPEGNPSTVLFEYIADSECQQGIQEFGDCFALAKASQSQSVGDDFQAHEVEAQIGCQDPENKSEVEAGKCLTPEVLYHFRAVAANADAPQGNPGSAATFETRPPLEITATYATDVGVQSATLNSTVDALGLTAAGFFEYVSDAACQEGLISSGDCFEAASVTGQINFGNGEEATRGIQVAALAPDTTYHYRLVAADALVDKIIGAEQTFTTSPQLNSIACPNETSREGLSSRLPNCRGYEMVTPVDKENGDIVVLRANDNNAPAEMPQASADGNRFTYSSYRPFGDIKSAPFTSQYMANHRSWEGWETHSISPPREGTTHYPVLSLDTQYKMFSEDLCSGWLLQDTEPRLGGGVAGYGNLYRRQNCGTEGYEALTTVKPAGASPEEYVPELVGASATGSVAVFRAIGKLTENAAAKTKNHQLYAASGGRLRLVSVLPNGSASKQDTSAGTGDAYAFRRGRLEHAVSADGSRIFWTEAKEGPGQLYVRNNVFGSGAECSSETAPCTLAVSASVGGDAAQFLGAAMDGSKVIFSFTEGPHANQLYQYDVISEEPKLIADKLRGVLGFSNDASRIYFASSEVLAPGAKEGQANIYLYEADEPPTFKLVATVSSLSLGGYCSNVSIDSTSRCDRVSADGSQLAFTSDSRLTSYENIDARSGEADAEVYLYETGDGVGDGSLLCVSCNPSGARPVGRGVRLFTGDIGAWIAAKIPSPKGAFHASRVLSEDGRRLFFESYDPLVATDTNGAEDVYQWEAATKSECAASGGGVFSPAARGCISLISSGQGGADSEFVDASASGDDVFFKTAQSLVLKDPGLIDIYDARVLGGEAPPLTPNPSCQGEACQPVPPPPLYSTPSSTTYEGPTSHKAKKRHKGMKKRHRRSRHKHTSRPKKHTSRQKQVGR
jgi:DNA-binding beta-propeller fold protein YncE